jgi:uncharacterized protein YjbI with pentapeptide repeats
MKHTILILFCLAGVAGLATAQTKINASEIVKKINANQPVVYNNVIIEGTLDLTDLANRTRHGSDNWSDRFSGNTDQYVSTVEVSLSFTNCTFQGDVLAYYHVEREHETYIAHFEQDVVFKNCTFREASEFKYSEFHGIATFTGTTFQQVANFKYAEFSSGPSFAQVQFNDGGDFKYTEFPRETSFQQASFSGLANFKYSKFRSPLNLEKVSFSGYEDFKYTKIDGRSFTSYLLESR